MKRSSRRRVAFSFVMSFFDKWIVRLKFAKKLGSLPRDSIKHLYANRKIRPVNHRAIICGNDLTNCVQLRLPTRCADDEWNPSADTRLSVFRNSISNRKINRHITAAEGVREFIQAAIGIVDIDLSNDLVTSFGGKFANELAHRAVSDKCNFHDCNLPLQNRER